MTPANILVVEDNPVTRKLLRVALAGEGFAVAEADSARAALEHVARGMPDLVLQDLVLPDMDGLELARRIREAPGGADVPLVALSGFLTRMDEARAVGASFTAYLVKPIEPSRLIDAVRSYLPAPAAAGPQAGQGRRLLLVDDDPVQLKLASIQIAAWGFDVATASDGAEALAAARARPPHVIVSDVLMPRMDGFQLCAAVRRDPALGGIPVVLVSSAYLEDADRRLAARVGASSLDLRTPDLAGLLPVVLESLERGAPVAPSPPDKLTDPDHAEHVSRVMRQLEHQLAAQAGIARRFAIQSAQLSLLAGMADALTRGVDPEAALRDVLAACLDAVGISKGAFLLAGATDTPGRWIGFSDAEREAVRGRLAESRVMTRLLTERVPLSVPSPGVPEDQGRALLDAAGVSSLQLVPLAADGQAYGALLLGSRVTDVVADDPVAFARAIGAQIAKSLALASAVSRVERAEARYRALIENAHDAIGVFTPEGQVLECNRRWEALFGVSRDTYVGRHFAQGLPPDRAAAADHFARILAEGTLQVADVPVLRADGAEILVDFSSSVILLGPERVVFTIARDVTERGRLRQQLLVSQKMEAMGRLAGGVAHDFNNLLAVILSNASFLLEDGASGQAAEDAGEIKRAAERAAALTRQLLAFSRHQAIELRQLDLNAIVSDMAKMLKRLIGEDVRLTTSLGGALGPVKADAGQIEQVVMNLAVNARDAMPHGGQLEIRTEERDLSEAAAAVLQSAGAARAERYVALTVADTGIGMDEATRARIFEPFFTTKEKGRGTGLGLATVYGIVTQLGGAVTVETAPSKGAAFTVWLPRAEKGPPSDLRRSVKLARKGLGTILLIEDEEMVRAVARRILASGGYRVLEAATGPEALALAERRGASIDLVVSDVVLPGASGPEIAARLRAARPDLKVVLMTGYVDHPTLLDGIDSLEAHLLHKPFSREQLLAKVQEALAA